MPTHGNVSPADAVAQDLPSREFHAQAPARTREEDYPPRPADAHAESLASQAAGQMAVRWAARAMDGSSLWTAQPPSLAMIWDRHAASARYYNGWIGSWPRFTWGAIHLSLAVAIYFLAWVTHSFPLFIGAVAIIAAAHWLL